LFVNPLISDPGTLEVEWNNTLGPNSYYQPQTWKYSVGRTEYSLGFDAIAHDSGTTHFSDHLTATATTVLYNGPHLDIAVAPQATFLLRNDSGVRLGATVLARYDFGKNSVSGSFGWTGATAASASTGGYRRRHRRLRPSGHEARYRLRQRPVGAFHRPALVPVGL